MWSEREEAIPILLVCDEAHRYIHADETLGFEPTRRSLSPLRENTPNGRFWIGKSVSGAFADSTRRPAQFRVWWRVFVDSCFRNEFTWVTQNCESVAIWSPPGTDELTARISTDLPEVGRVKSLVAKLERRWRIDPFLEASTITEVRTVGDLLASRSSCRS